MKRTAVVPPRPMTVQSNPRLLSRIAMVALCLCTMLSCEDQPPPLTIVRATLKKEMARSTAVPDEFSSFAPSSLGYNVWVEGSVRNAGPVDLMDVVLTFKGSDGNETRTLMAHIKSIRTGETLDFRTRMLPSKYDIKLLDEEPEVRFSKE